jgi:cystathionine beta-lyase/cystathionine gamma-synthase
MIQPIDLSSYWPIKDPANPFQSDFYQRVNHPAARKFEQALKKLEGAEHALCFAWGMTAIHTLIFTVMRIRDVIILAKGLYSGTTNLCLRYEKKFCMEVDIVDLRDLNKVNYRGHLRMIFLESPSNPRIWLADIEELCRQAHAHNVLVAVDNTFCTLLLQNPLALGADFVVYSTTKTISGHGNSGGGAILFNDDRWLPELAENRTIFGGIQKPFDAVLQIEGMKTLPLRLERMMSNAYTLADRLEKHPKVEKVFYPGLESFPQRDLVKKQMRVGGAMMAFFIKGDLAAADRLVGMLKKITISVSTGSCASLIQIPHQAAKRPDRIGGDVIPETLIRFSAGVENVEELWSDLEQALAAV